MQVTCTSPEVFNPNHFLSLVMIYIQILTDLTVVFESEIKDACAQIVVHWRANLVLSTLI